MKQLPEDKLKELSPERTRAYLLAHGWQAVGTIGTKGIILENQSRSYEIALPTSTTLADYEQRIGELIFTLSKLEERDVSEILNDIRFSGYDVVRVRVLDNTSDGSIPLSSTENIIEYARKMLLSSASACVDPKKFYGSFKPKRAEQYIDTVRLGQTEIGSYVFTLLSPVVLSDAGNVNLSVDRFGREVSLMFDNALGKIKTEADKTNTSIPSLLNSEGEGINYNFCDALSGIIREAGKTEFSVSLADKRTTLAVPYQPKVFKSSSYEFISELSSSLKKPDVKSGVTLSGFVRLLDKDKSGLQGSIILKALVDGKLRPVHMHLDQASYSVAYQSHENLTTVAVTGDLVKKGRYTWLENPRHFQIEADQESSLRL